MDTEFLISETQMQGDFLVVGGIVNKGAIVLDCAFVGLVKAHQQQIPLSLRVVKITAYRHEIPALPTGMSGQLYLLGKQEGRIEENDMLVA